SSGCPGYLIWPFSPSSLNQASHFCMDFCISSGDCAVGSLPRKRNVNSLIVCPLGSYASHLRRSSEAAPDIFLSGRIEKKFASAYAAAAAGRAHCASVCCQAGSARKVAYQRLISRYGSTRETPPPARFICAPPE